MITTRLCIYIPVWIDLKERLLSAEFLQISIYIPVWIDLKLLDDELREKVIKIYIPVWIDLKTASLIKQLFKAVFTFQYG